MTATVITPCMCEFVAVVLFMLAVICGVYELHRYRCSTEKDILGRAKEG